MNKALTILLVIFLFNSCKKEESWEYWDNLANEKFEEITNLSKNYSCNDIPSLTIQEIEKICPSSIIIHTKDLKKFEQLYEDFRTYNEKAKKSGRPEVYLLCANTSTIKIGCKDNKPYLIDAYNISAEDLEIEMSKLYTEIKKHYTSSTCANISQWRGMTLYTGENKEAIAINSNDGNLNKKIILYRLLNCRKLQLQNKACILDYNLKIKLSCVNNTVRAEFE